MPASFEHDAVTGDVHIDVRMNFDRGEKIGIGMVAGGLALSGATSSPRLEALSTVLIAAGNIAFITHAIPHIRNDREVRRRIQDYNQLNQANESEG